MKGRVLVIGSSDSSGATGIEADIKTVTALGGYAATAVTAVAAQSTERIIETFNVPADFVAKQISVVLEDIGADCIKTGLMNRPDVIDAVADTLTRKAPGIPVVVDPALLSRGGRQLTKAAAEHMKKRLIPLATLLKVNAPEAEALTAMEITNADDVAPAVEILGKLGPKNVLMTSGHLYGDELTDFFLNDQGTIEQLAGQRIATNNDHGIGCTLATAIATGLSQGLDMRSAIVRGRTYVRDAILSAPGLGRGRGPVNHGHTVRPFGD